MEILTNMTRVQAIRDKKRILKYLKTLLARRKQFNRLLLKLAGHKHLKGQYIILILLEI